MRVILLIQTLLIVSQVSRYSTDRYFLENSEPATNVIENNNIFFIIAIMTQFFKFLSFLLLLLILFCFENFHCQYFLETIAGTGTAGDTGDSGPALSGELNAPQSIWVDSIGNVYVAECGGAIIRKISSSGFITTIAGAAGTASNAGSAGGPALSVALDSPTGVYGDSEGKNLYFNGNYYVWKYSFSSQIVTRIGGVLSSSGTFSGDGGPGTSANFDNLKGMYLATTGLLYVTDKLNNRVRTINVTSPDIVHTFAGNGSAFYGGDGKQATSAAIKEVYGVFGNTANDVYIADRFNNRVRLVNPSGIITTVAGTGAATSTGDGALANSATLNAPSDVKQDTLGNLYVVELNSCRIRMIDTANIISTIIGSTSTCTAASTSTQIITSTTTMSTAYGIFVDTTGKIYFPEYDANYVRTVTYVPPSALPTAAPSASPSAIPTVSPTITPSQFPTRSPTVSPSIIPTVNPTVTPSASPSVNPSVIPTAIPTAGPTFAPSATPTSTPSASPTYLPTSEPSSRPTPRPSCRPSMKPTGQPSMYPTSRPSNRPTIQPSSRPSRRPTVQPSDNPTVRPTSQPSTQPTIQPIARPTEQPTIVPSINPTGQPSNQPTMQPTSQPSSQPTCFPSVQPSSRPSGHPTSRPSTQPTSTPSMQPTGGPSGQPSGRPSTQPTNQPSGQPSCWPSCFPTSQPTGCPSAQPTRLPSSGPSSQPTCLPSGQPSNNPSIQPTSTPSSQPSTEPSTFPTNQPSSMPSAQPSNNPSSQPSCGPSTQPTYFPSCQPTGCPSAQPSSRPSSQPSGVPSDQPSSEPSRQPTSTPSSQPSAQPSRTPTSQPSSIPSGQPTSVPSSQPSGQPSSVPSSQPSSRPSGQPSTQPSGQPSCQPSSNPTSQPTSIPRSQPTGCPSAQPSSRPSSQPTSIPSRQPTGGPTRQPTGIPSNQPGALPSNIPTTQPSLMPSGQPTIVPSSQPSCQPSSRPTHVPSGRPTFSPSGQPSEQPCARPSTFPSSVPSVFPTLLYYPSRFLYVSDSFNRFRISIFPFNHDLLSQMDQTITNMENRSVGNSYLFYGGINVDRNEFAVMNLTCEVEVKQIQPDIVTRSLSLIGDINLDGFADLLLGDPIANRAFVYSRLRHFSNHTYYQKTMIVGDDDFGWSVSSAGDMNQDGYEDIVIGTFQSAIVYVVLGSTTLLNSPTQNITDIVAIKKGFQLKGSAINFAVSNAGDFNDDGYDDIVLSFANNLIYIIFGSQYPQDINLAFLAPSQGLTIQTSSFSFAGLSLSGLGDINGDGIDDIVIGSVPYKSGYDTQFSYVVYGNKSFTDSTMILTEITSNGTLGFTIEGGGFMVSGVGDVNGDGYADMMITSYSGWIGKGNTYIIPYPDLVGTRAPSSAPSQRPTNSPEPTITPISSRPSSFPTTSLSSFRGNGSFTLAPVTPNTQIPTFTKSKSPSFYPSMFPTTTPTRVQTIRPSIYPSRLPSIRDTNQPTLIPTFHPSYRPSTSPSFLPTALPTIQPSLQPTISSSQPFTFLNITLIGNYVLPDGNIQITIKANGNVIIAGEHTGKRIYKIYPELVNHTIIEIDNFNVALDILDVSLFVGISNLQEISYSTEPVTIVLSSYQEVTLSGVTEFTLTAENFIFTTESEGSPEGEENSSVPDHGFGSIDTAEMSVLVIAAVFLTSTFIFGFFCAEKSYISILKVVMIGDRRSRLLPTIQIKSDQVPGAEKSKQFPLLGRNHPLGILPSLISFTNTNRQIFSNRFQRNEEDLSAVLELDESSFAIDDEESEKNGFSREEGRRNHSSRLLPSYSALRKGSVQSNGYFDFESVDDLEESEENAEEYEEFSEDNELPVYDDIDFLERDEERSNESIRDQSSRDLSFCAESDDENVSLECSPLNSSNASLLQEEEERSETGSEIDM